MVINLSASKVSCMHKPQPWSPADATLCINALGKSDDLTFNWTEHAEDRMAERGLIVGDVLHVLKRGFVLDPYETSTRPNSYKYRIQSTTPNSGNRSVAVVVIADATSQQVKIVTVMWQDEK
jgi:hypothetical protein